MKAVFIWKCKDEGACSPYLKFWFSSIGNLSSVLTCDDQEEVEWPLNLRLRPAFLFDEFAAVFFPVTV